MASPCPGPLPGSQEKRGAGTGDRRTGPRALLAGAREPRRRPLPFPVSPSPEGSSPRGPAQARLPRSAPLASAEAGRPDSRFSSSLTLCVIMGALRALGLESNVSSLLFPNPTPPNRAPRARAPTKDGDTGQSPPTPPRCTCHKAGQGRGQCANRVRVPWASQHTGDSCERLNLETRHWCFQTKPRS